MSALAPFGASTTKAPPLVAICQNAGGAFLCCRLIGAKCLEAMVAMENQAPTTEEIDTAQRYQQRAKELRIVAEDRHAPNIRAMLLAIADSYEEMAASMVRIDHTNQMLAKTFPRGHA